MARTWDDTAAVLRDLALHVPDLARRTAALAITGQGDGTWLIDGDGEPVAPAWLWLDSRAAGIVRELMAGEPRLRLVERPVRSGLGSAYEEGFGRALEEGFDLIVEMDSDLSHDPTELGALLETARGRDDLLPKPAGAGRAGGGRAAPRDRSPPR